MEWEKKVDDDYNIRKRTLSATSKDTVSTLK